jgi:hypothetical protein
MNYRVPQGNVLRTFNFVRKCARRTCVLEALIMRPGKPISSWYSFKIFGFSTYCTPIEK